MITHRVLWCNSFNLLDLRIAWVDIQSVISHLIFQNIQKGEPILFHFSNKGCVLCVVKVRQNGMTELNLGIKYSGKIGHNQL